MENFGRSESTAGIILRLVVLSLIVGVVLSALGITPQNLFYTLNVLAKRLYDLGFGAIDWILQYILVGAMVVVPIWLITRIVRGVQTPKN